MERESFENERIAELLNRDFVPIKVDREERPDVDRIYMTFVQATTGSGGWPMSVWLTPDLQPFFGGTYFPPDNRYGHPGFPLPCWTQLRRRLAERPRRRSWIRRARWSEQLRQHAAVEAGRRRTDRYGDAGQRLLSASAAPSIRAWAASARRPSFRGPRSTIFCCATTRARSNHEALDMVLLTLREMAKGGIDDQLGGGFHRYSVDERWFVPHFEKMLYDQAQLATSYLEAFQITGDPLYAATARRILDYVLRDMTAPEGGFYSAEDADSVIDPAQPEVKGEGAFYIWSAAEIRALCRRAGRRLVLLPLRRRRRRQRAQRPARRIHRPEYPLPGAHASRKPRSSSAVRSRGGARRAGAGRGRALLRCRARRACARTSTTRS